MSDDELEDETFLDRQLSPDVNTPQLRVAVDAGDDALTLRYEIDNRTGAPILVNTLFGNPKTPGRFDPNRAFHRIDDGVLVFLKAAVAPPAPIAVPQLPSSRRVSPGDRFEDSLTVPLPVTFDNPMLFAEPGKRYDPVECRGVRLRVGWIFQSDLPETIDPVTVGDLQVYNVPMAALLKFQRFVESDTIPVRLLVVDPLPSPPG